MKTKEITLYPSDAMNVLRTVEDQTPFSLLIGENGVAASTITMEVWADGSPAPFSIVLHASGLWQMKAELELS